MFYKVETTDNGETSVNFVSFKDTCSCFAIFIYISVGKRVRIQMCS